jgi:hypothetical protein
MKDSINRPLLADIRAELGALGNELRETAFLRWELARLELQSDLRSTKSLAIDWLVAAAMALTAMPLLAVCVADKLDGCGQIGRDSWLLILASGLLALALLLSYTSWRRFRRRFVGLQQTLEELREDLLWLRAQGK